VAGKECWEQRRRLLGRRGQERLVGRKGAAAGTPFEEEAMCYSKGMLFFFVFEGNGQVTVEM
jgi:hypothetical protein